MPPPDSFLRRRLGGPVLLAVILLTGVAGAFALAWLFGPRPRPDAHADPAAAAEANNRGVGRMERYEYAEAAAEFDLAARLDPDWTAARVNGGIARFNTTNADDIAAAEQIFRDVLAREPDNRHARYCLGIIAEYQNRTTDAHAHFAAVRDLDPADAHTWLHLGLTHPAGRDSADGRACFERALALNPYLNAARYALARAVMPTDPARGRRLLADHKALIDANWEAESRLTYGEMGRYADVIGRSPGGATPRPLPLFESVVPAVALAPGTRWAAPADFGPGPVGDLRRAVRERFGGTVVVLDFNGDGRPDVLLLAAVVRDGGVGDLLLRNDGGNTFTDVTAVAGLAAPRPSLGAAAADYDNDGRPDLFVTGAGRQYLFRNRGDGTFEDVSAAAGADRVPGVCLSAGWSDLDQDGDLDLVVCRYAGTAEDALAALTGEAAPGGGLAVLLNAGVAPPAAGPPPPLTTKFLPDDRLAKAAPAGRPVGVVFTDADADRDVDAVVLLDGAAPVTVLNDRLLRFRAGAPVGPPGRSNGGLVVAGEHRERSDLFVVTPGEPPVWQAATGATGWEPRPIAAPPLLHAVAADFDLDGRTDVLGLTRSGPLLIHNRGGRWEPRPGALGDTPAGPLAAAAADLDGDSLPDVLLWSASGVHVLRNLGNGNRAVSVAPTGRRDTGSNLRTNADALGAWVTAHAGPVAAAAERTTVSAGLGQSSGPTVLGVGPAARADAVRVRWPDGVIQAELGVPAGPPFRVTETNRKGTSCPVLLAWDGAKFAFVTDFLGAGALGELGPDGAVRPPRPEESVKIEPGQLVPRNGEYVLKIAEPMDEVLYLDRVELLAVDHPAGVVVFPDERFAPDGPPPSQELLAFPTRYFAATARDHRGRNVTAAVRDRDRVAADGFAPRSWLGYAEDHELRLEFAGLPAAAGGRWFLGLAGWTEYPYPESIFAATQAGVRLGPPALERLDGGAWRPVCDLGFPAGLPRVMTREVSVPIPADGRLTLRIRTNMQVYWDQVFLAPADATRAARATALPLSGASVAARGFMREVLPGGRPPVGYDDSATEPVAVTRWDGYLTRAGDVADLLRAADDRFVLCGPGDEITVRFAAGPAALPTGWERSYVLRTWGYCKDTTPFTATGGRVSPLPFRGMTTYPPPEPPPATDAAQWHTRSAGADF